jgi:hypothetical protein
MPLSVQIPAVGQANTTEEPKIANSLTNLSAWANGSVADTDLRSPPNAVRRLVLENSAILDDSIAAGDRIFTSDAYPVASGAAGYYPAVLWVGDAGLSGQPPDFQVANKTAVARVRGTLAASAPATATLTLGLYQITGVGGTGRGVSYTFAAAYGGSTVAVASPAAGITSFESAEFALPVSAVYALGSNLSAPLPSGCAIAVSLQLYAYNV